MYLTNSLLGWGTPPEQTELPIQDFETEIRDAYRAKTADPILVVLGNPPYHGYSKVEHPEEQALLAPWTGAARARWGLRKHRMGDLYVRFWRMAVQRIVDMTGRGVVSFITNRKWLGGRSFPSMREAIATSFDRIYIADLHGGTHDTSVPGDESVFTTSIASGIRVGTAIVTAVKTGRRRRTPVATARARDFRGTAASKRSSLHGLSIGPVEGGFRPRAIDPARRYKFTDNPEGDYPSLEEYFTFFISGVQPVRDEAVMDLDNGRLESRMQSYFDPGVTNALLRRNHPGFFVTRARYDAPRSRNRLLASSAFHSERIVRYMFRPFDNRWLYWEPDHKLLNEPRRELMPHWLGIAGQRAIVATQTPRRPGAARPVSSTALPCFEAADPNSRVMPRLLTVRPEEGDHQALFTTAAATRETKTNIADEWIEAARAIGVTSSDTAVGDVIFYALHAISNSPQWLATQPIEGDDFPQIPIPGTLAELLEAATLGRRVADLMDPDTPVRGVTTGTIRASLRTMAAPDPVTRYPVLVYGTHGRQGGQFEHSTPTEGSVLWGPGAGWRNVPRQVWNFKAVGHQLLPKWLSYRVGEPLSPADREHFTHVVRRIAALVELQDEADALHTAAQRTALGI